MRHPEYYERSLELQDKVKEYKSNKEYDKLEETLIELIEVYSGLNFCEEDEYLEEVIECYKTLKDIYIIKKKPIEMFETYRLIIEAYDYIIQRDVHEEELKQKHINELKEIYAVLKQLYAKVNIENDIKDEFPNIAEYLD